ncbi:MAG: hypothetical protein Q8K58_09285 [Acidimicrobiales bacterium]|nr:hypothetical protein [Acidimicrobiales bacterium]
MRLRSALAILAALALALAHALVVSVASAALVAPAGAQELPVPPSVQVPARDIVPEPNSGREPEEAGDRGGALQLLVLGVVVVGVGGAAWHLARTARRAGAG